MLKKLILVLGLSLGYILQDQGQATAHKPAELVKIMKDSKLSYSQGELYIDVQDLDYSNLVNEPNIYREDSSEQMVVKKIKLAKEAEQEWNDAERAMQDKNYKEARKHYKNVLDVQADYYPAKIQIAKTFEQEGDLEKAEAAYKQAISKNYIDYMPHWLIAEDYLKEKKYDDAISEITLASVLNRNDTTVLMDLGEIYAAANLKYQDWEFTPQYKVFKSSQKPNEIKVLSQKGWSGYAIGKAIWGFEAGYPESQGEHSGKPSLIEEKECLLSLLAGQDTMKEAMDDITIMAVQDAKEYKLLDGFIYYEELLPQQPSLVYQLPNNVIKGIKNYVVLAHGGEVPKKK